LQETPALSGSGARRNIARRDIYDLEQSPSLVAVAQEEVSVTEEVSANDVSMNEVSEMITGVAEESFAGAVGEDTSAGADVPDESAQEEESRVEEEPIKQPLRRGRKRKSDALEPTADKESPVVQKKTRAESKQAATTEKEEAPVEQPAKRPRGRPKRVSEIVEEQLESADASMDESAQTADSPVPAQPKRRGRPPKAASMNSPVQAEESPAPAQPKRRGRPPKDKVDAPPSRPGQDEEEATAKTRTKQTKSKASESAPSDEATEEPTFKKPKAVGRPKGKATEKAAKAPEPAPGRLVDALGKPLSKDDIEQMSTTSAGSRYNRGRALSYFRELGAEEFGRISRTGRRNIPPINFWLNEHAQYDRDGNLVRVVQNEAVDEPPRKRGPKSKGKKKAASAEEDEEEELEDWEVNDGVFVGPYLDFDISTETTSEEQLESSMLNSSQVHNHDSEANNFTALAWAAKGIQPQQVPNAQFKFTKLGSAGSGFFSWGCLELDADDIKRTKNSRRMHMSFHVTKGAVEVNVNNNLFTVHKGGVWQVPRGEFLPFSSLFSALFFHSSLCFFICTTAVALCLSLARHLMARYTFVSAFPCCPTFLLRNVVPREGPG
jgi:centromere protein C